MGDRIRNRKYIILVALVVVMVIATSCSDTENQNGASLQFVHRPVNGIKVEAVADIGLEGFRKVHLLDDGYIAIVDTMDKLEMTRFDYEGTTLAENLRSNANRFVLSTSHSRDYFYTLVAELDSNTGGAGRLIIDRFDLELNYVNTVFVDSTDIDSLDEIIWEINDFEVAGDDQFLIGTNMELLRVDGDGKMVDRLYANVQEIEVADEHTAYYAKGTYPVMVKKLDLDSFKPEEGFEILNGSDCKLYFNKGEKALYTLTDYGLYAYHDDELLTITDQMVTLYNPMHISDFTYLEQKGYIVSNEESFNSKICELKTFPTYDYDIENRVIKVVTSDISDKERRALRSFEQSLDRIAIQIVDPFVYYHDKDYTEAMLEASETADVLMLNDEDSIVVDLIDAERVEDLHPLMTADDTFNIDEFYENIIEDYYLENSLYEFPSAVVFDAWIVNGTYLDKAYSDKLKQGELDWEELLGLALALKEVYPDETIIHSYFEMSEATLAVDILVSNLTNLLKYEEGAYLINPEEFDRWLKVAQEFFANELVVFDTSFNRYYKEMKGMIEPIHVRGYGDLIELQQHHKGAIVTMPYYLNAEQGIPYKTVRSYAMLSQDDVEKKEVCWELIKHMNAVETQADLGLYHVSVNRKANDVSSEAFMANADATDVPYLKSGFDEMESLIGRLGRDPYLNTEQYSYLWDGVYAVLYNNYTVEEVTENLESLLND